MARAKAAKTSPKKETRRGSPEAIAKRRAARALNSIFDAGPGADAALDGRSLKRKRRLIQELQEGKGGEALKAHEVLSHATELYGFGENLTSLRKLKPRLPATPPMTDETIAAIKETQASYNFHPNAWKLLGIDIDALSAPAPSGEAPKRKGKRKAA